MRIPWSGDRCIVCLKADPLSDEHIIPKALGGALSCKFLCKPCNERFGAGYEARAKSDPALRLSVSRLRAEVPAIHALIEEGQPYLIESGPARLGGLWRSGVVRGAIKKLDDGSLMVPGEHVQSKLREILTADGHDEAFIAEALATQAQTPVGERVDLSDTIGIVNWPAVVSGPDMSDGQPLLDLAVVKMAYEFIALLVGTAIYEDARQLANIRGALQGQSDSSSVFTVERLAANKDGSFHGIAFEGNDPHARVQVRLFGKWAYRVHFLWLSVQHPPIAYTHDLKTGEHWHNGAAGLILDNQNSPHERNS